MGGGRHLFKPARGQFKQRYPDKIGDLRSCRKIVNPAEGRRAIIYWLSAPALVPDRAPLSSLAVTSTTEITSP